MPSRSLVTAWTARLRGALPPVAWQRHELAVNTDIDAMTREQELAVAQGERRGR
jgi:hypothetical protein